jgi:hypothetical protein
VIVPLAAGHGERNDLFLQPPLLDRRRGPGVRLGGEHVLVLAGDPQAGLVAVGRRAHRDAVEPADQRIGIEGIAQWRVTVAEAARGPRGSRYGALDMDSVPPAMTTSQ